MIYLHKILPLLMSPIIIVMLLIITGAVTRQRRWSLLAILLLYLASTPIISDFIFRQTERNAIKLNPVNIPTANAVVVLSGMLTTVASTEGITYEWDDSDRFFSGVELFKKGIADKLIFTNGILPWKSQSDPEGIVLKKYAESLGVRKKDIFVTTNAQNTEQEAILIKKMLGNHNPSLILVTSAFHMPRASQIFRGEGLIVHEYPVDFKIDIRQITLMDFLPKASSLLRTSIAIREQIGVIYYWLKYSDS